MSKNKEKTSCNGEIYNIPPHLIRPNPALARTDFSDTSILALADSIKRYGILQPLAVKLSDKGRYELIAGERRLRAAILMHMHSVPCVLIENLCDLECLSVVENIQRDKLTMFDEARALRRIYEKNGRDTEKTAKLLSMTEQEFLVKLRLCMFTRAEMQALTSLGISEDRASVFLDVPNGLRYYTIKLCAEKGYSPAETHELCRALSDACKLYERKIYPDGLEEFADKFFAEKDKDKPASLPPQAVSKPTVILKDLRSFEISLRRICAILENTGCSTRLRIKSLPDTTTYTITVNTTKNN